MKAFPMFPEKIIAMLGTLSKETNILAKSSDFICLFVPSGLALAAI
jgi:hypothetical protein